MDIENLVTDPHGVIVNTWTGKANAAPWRADARGLAVERVKDGGEAYMESPLMPVKAGVTYVFAGDISAAGDSTTGSGGVFRPIWRDQEGNAVSDDNPNAGGASLKPNRRAIGEVTAPAGATQMTLRIHAPLTTGKAYIMNRILVMSKPEYEQLQKLGFDYMDFTLCPLTHNGGGECRPQGHARRLARAQWVVAA
ncbi:hypothetical protein [Bifidobacterium biavatii]|uniref:Uncharacterized protein n=1 Tax=Bifidobacterium biavatii DSM 23969 TaxID=1437608 RepID=A0A086ZU03_9BIFI|nr:hypothetical protein [Bifidobacterium biavatii]KFI50003.1 hypothetical protein BBIA_2136 [Bifidobacterium biavatii DSM 23969]